MTDQEEARKRHEAQMVEARKEREKARRELEEANQRHAAQMREKEMQAQREREQ